MELLQRLHRKLAVTFCGTDAFYSCLCSSHGCNIRNTVLNGSLTNVAVVGCTLLAAGSIDNQLDLVIRDLIRMFGRPSLSLHTFRAGIPACSIRSQVLPVAIISKPS